MGYPTGFDADVECVSSDEKSDTEGKNETTSSISSNNTGNSTADTSATLEVSIALKSTSDGEMWGLRLYLVGARGGLRFGGFGWLVGFGFFSQKRMVFIARVVDEE